MFMSLAMVRKSICIMFIGGLIVTSAASAAEDCFWPQFHGPSRDNLSTERGLLKKWAEAAGTWFFQHVDCSGNDLHGRQH